MLYGRGLDEHERDRFVQVYDFFGTAFTIAAKGGAVEFS